MDYHKPLPHVTEDNREFWNGCKAHELRFQKCRICAHIRWPASIICPLCHSKETDWVIASGKGKVYTFAVYHVAYHPGFKDDLPYVVALVALEEGPHLLTNIVDCLVEEVKVDMPVMVTWQDITEDFALPKFRPRLNAEDE
ncbi:MAG: Zn-ribbon domain-containing OB-fold protein [Deltaproteobacteria bacterium]|nr:Zn-ribbon domain-containing OB-fold protein [Deltaproteobacteria bacterium]